MISYPGKITGVYFGMNMPSIEKRMIGMILSPELNDQIQFYQMDRALGKHELVARQFNIKTDLSDFGEALKL